MRLDADAATFQRYAYSLYSNGSPQCTTSLPHRYLGSRMCTEGVTALLRDLNHQQKTLASNPRPHPWCLRALAAPSPLFGTSPLPRTPWTTYHTWIPPSSSPMTPAPCYTLPPRPTASMFMTGHALHKFWMDWTIYKQLPCIPNGELWMLHSRMLPSP